MPRINITEVEEQTFAAFDVTENTVLIPLLYARTLNEAGDIYLESEENIPGKLFTSAKDFSNNIGSHRVNVDGEYDKSYVMAYELLLQGMNVVIKPITYDNMNEGKDLTIDRAYEILENAINYADGEDISSSALEEFENRNVFNIKFITTGAYANIGRLYTIENGSDEEEVTKETTSYSVIRQLAEIRGDAIALLEYKENFIDADELFEAINATVADTGADYYAAAFFPWFTSVSTVRNVATEYLMPACFGYLMAYANSVKNNANWFAAAGVNRGYIPNMITPSFEVGEALMHQLQGDEGSLPFVVNPIYNAGTYGYRIWGNRVFSSNNGTSYRDRYINFLNVRILMCDIKKQIYHAAMRVTFEPNDDIVWINFKTLANSVLERMKSGRGVSWYKWTKEIAEDKATIKATLTIQPIEAVESFDFTIVLTDEDASIAESI